MYKNRNVRLSTILSSLSKGDDLSTPNLALKFNASHKIIQADFNEYLLPLFHDNTIYYDHSSKSYKAKANFLKRTLLSAEDLALIAILKNKSKDKYSDNDLYVKVETLFENYEKALSQSIYSLANIERFDKFKYEIIQIQHSINTRRIIKCMYRNKERKLYPLHINNLDGFWYLICFDTNYKDIRKYHLNSISNVAELPEVYEFDNTGIIKSFDNAINAYYKPEKKPIHIELFLHSEIAKYFIRKPISKTQRLLTEYKDSSCDIELTITDYMEIIPTIQRYMPYIGVIEPIELKEIIQNNIKKYNNIFGLPS
ncbi:MAG: WYL domain-containing protein [Sulfurimonas sp.]